MSHPGAQPFGLPPQAGASDVSIRRAKPSPSSGQTPRRTSARTIAVVTIALTVVGVAAFLALRSADRSRTTPSASELGPVDGAARCAASWNASDNEDARRQLNDGFAYETPEGPPRKVLVDEWAGTPHEVSIVGGRGEEEHLEPGDCFLVVEANLNELWIEGASWRFAGNNFPGSGGRGPLRELGTAKANASVVARHPRDPTVGVVRLVGERGSRTPPPERRPPAQPPNTDPEGPPPSEYGEQRCGAVRYTSPYGSGTLDVIASGGASCADKDIIARAAAGDFDEEGESTVEGNLIGEWRCWGGRQDAPYEHYCLPDGSNGEGGPRLEGR